jgi:hypothetical protein
VLRLGAPIAVASALLGLVGSPAAALAEASKDAPYDQAAISAALNQAPGTHRSIEQAGASLEVPPPPPRKKGIVLEASVGITGFAGKLNTISPTASNFHLQLGYEPFRWLMVFAETDLGFTSTRYASVSRGYAIYGFGGGVRGTIPVSERVSVYAQGDLGMMEASSNVLHPYGFYEAENLNAYFGATGGLEWYQADPHYALAVNGGVRKTPGFERALNSDPALSWLAAVALRYTF